LNEMDRPTRELRMNHTGPSGSGSRRSRSRSPCLPTRQREIREVSPIRPPSYHRTMRLVAEKVRSARVQLDEIETLMSGVPEFRG
jgi:hypothetical protein